MADPAARIIAVSAGPVGRIGPDGIPSAFVKTRLHGPVAVGPLGLEGDAQADRRAHGGPEKAVYLYPAEYYPLWQAAFPALAARLVPGSLGENLTIAGIDPEAACVDDILAAGSVLLQIAHPRIPCHKIGLVLGDDAVGRMMRDRGWRGFQCKVLRPGTLQAGDVMTLIARPSPGRLIADVRRGVGAGGLAR